MAKVSNVDLQCTKKPCYIWGRRERPREIKEKCKAVDHRDTD